jgi:hypothetical protein
MILPDKEYINNIKRRAVGSLIALIIAALLLFFLDVLGIDRKTKGYITWFVFWPVYIYSLYQSILVAAFYFKNRMSLGIVFLLMTLPTFLFLLYLLYKITIPLS